MILSEDSTDGYETVFSTLSKPTSSKIAGKKNIPIDLTDTQDNIINDNYECIIPFLNQLQF
jgi:hypothetical protein